MDGIIKVKNYELMIDHYGQTKGIQRDTYYSRKRTRIDSLQGEVETFEIIPKRIRVDEHDLPRKIFYVESYKYHNMLSWWSLDTKNYFIREYLAKNILQQNFQLNININNAIFYDVKKTQYMLCEQMSKIYIDDIDINHWSEIIYSAGETLGKLHSKLWSDIEKTISDVDKSRLKELNSCNLDDVFSFYAKTLRDMGYSGYIFPGLDNLRYQFKILYEELGLENDPQVFVHGNYTTYNILINKKDKVIESLIGWGEAGIGSPFADWVNIHLSLVDYGLRDPIIMDWFLQGYQKHCHRDIIPLVQNYKKILKLWSRLMAYSMETISLWINDDNYPDRKIKYAKWNEIVN